MTSFAGAIASLFGIRVEIDATKTRKGYYQFTPTRDVVYFYDDEDWTKFKQVLDEWNVRNEARDRRRGDVHG